MLLRRQVGLAGSCSHWLLPRSEQKGGFGGASAHRMAELAEPGGRVLGLRLRCGGADEGGGGVGWGAAAGRWRSAAPDRRRSLAETSPGPSERSPALSVSSDITGRVLPPRRPAPGAYALKQGTPASCQPPPSQLACSPDASVLAMRLFLFHVAITYVCSRGSLSTPFRSGREHM